MSYPIVELVFTEDEQAGTYRISFVENPANQIPFITMSDEDKVWMSDQEERIAYGAILVPDQLFYRNFPGIGEVQAYFSKDTIRKSRDKYFKEALTSVSNAEHTDFLLDGVYLVDSIIKNSAKGINPPDQFKDLPDGTWFAGFKVDNDTIWNEFVKKGVFKGFSIEGFYKPVMEDDMSLLLNKVEGLIDQLKS